MTDDHNPYSAPRHDAANEAHGPGEEPPGTIVLASYLARLTGALIDVGIAWGVRWLTSYVTVRFVLHSDRWTTLQGRRYLIVAGLALGFSAASVLAVQASLIARRAQSIGKLVMGTRIVRADGRPAGLFHGFVIRTMPFSLLGLLPAFVELSQLSYRMAGRLQVLAAVVGFVNVVLVFAADRRCAHDLIAGTFVAKLRSQGALRGARLTRPLAQRTLNTS